MSVYLYILRRADDSYYVGSYYVGTTVGSLDKRVAEHQAGRYDGYTASRSPVVLVFQQNFERLDDAAAAERQVKGWRREKKKALIRGDFAALPFLACGGATAVRPSRRGPRAAPSEPVNLFVFGKNFTTYSGLLDGLGY